MRRATMASDYRGFEREKHQQRGDDDQNAFDE